MFTIAGILIPVDIPTYLPFNFLDNSFSAISHPAILPDLENKYPSFETLKTVSGLILFLILERGISFMENELYSLDDVYFIQRLALRVTQNEEYGKAKFMPRIDICKLEPFCFGDPNTVVYSSFYGFICHSKWRCYFFN